MNEITHLYCTTCGYFDVPGEDPWLDDRQSGSVCPSCCVGPLRWADPEPNPTCKVFDVDHGTENCLKLSQVSKFLAALRGAHTYRRLPSGCEIYIGGVKAADIRPMYHSKDSVEVVNAWLHHLYTKGRREWSPSSNIPSSQTIS